MTEFQNQLLKDNKQKSIQRQAPFKTCKSDESSKKGELLRWSEKCVGAVDKVSGSNDIQPSEEKKLFQLFCPQRPLLQVV